MARTTPALLGLFSLVALWATALCARGRVQPWRAAWYGKAEITFSDALAAVRHQLWTAEIISLSPVGHDVAEIPRPLLDRLITAACHPA